MRQGCGLELCVDVDSGFLTELTHRMFSLEWLDPFQPMMNVERDLLLVQRGHKNPETGNLHKSLVFVGGCVKLHEVVLRNVDAHLEDSFALV